MRKSAQMFPKTFQISNLRQHCHAKAQNHERMPAEWRKKMRPVNARFDSPQVIPPWPRRSLFGKMIILGKTSYS
jgi:hypothetical protein